MADRDLRRLERRWEETRSPEDEGVLLLARIRAGTLRREQLQVAALLGHEGARQALGSSAPTALREPRDNHGFVRWLVEMEDRTGIMNGVRSGISAFRQTLELLEDYPREMVFYEVCLELLEQVILQYPFEGEPDLHNHLLPDMRERAWGLMRDMQSELGEEAYRALMPSALESLVLVLSSLLRHPEGDHTQIQLYLNSVHSQLLRAYQDQRLEEPLDESTAIQRLYQRCRHDLAAFILESQKFESRSIKSLEREYFRRYAQLSDGHETREFSLEEVQEALREDVEETLDQSDVDEG